MKEAGIKDPEKNPNLAVVKNKSGNDRDVS
jgi:hypothetical protein